MPRPLAETVHGIAVGEVVHFVFLNLGDSEVAQGSVELNGVRIRVYAVRGCQRMHVTDPGEDMYGKFHDQTARGVVRSVGDADDLGVSQQNTLEHTFGTRAYGERPRRSPYNVSLGWQIPGGKNGTAEQVMHKIPKSSKAILNERGRPVSEWITVLPSVHRALNTAAWKRFGTSPFTSQWGVSREPRSRLWWRRVASC